ncbi:MAG: insulinase family protein [Bacilli bacterium]|nr:insulinase family protein [Bacilli bacterium]
MEKKLKYLDEKIIYHKLDNGMLVYLISDKKKKEYDISLTVKYGSCDRCYKIGDEVVCDVPGLAHYLEHQLFTMPNEDSFNYFSQSGTYANAGTSYFSTRYYISGTKCFMKNLKYFLKMLYTPFFTDESVLKEQGIIKEEIMMYDDTIDWIIDKTLRNNLFNNHPIRDNIAGSINDIKKITKEDLYQAYNYFYIPNNMILTISGDFDIDKTLEMLNKTKFLKKDNHEIIRIYDREDEITKSEYSELYGNTTIPKISYGFKINKNKFKIKDDYLLNLYLNCLFYILFDETSLFSEEVYQNNYCVNYFIEHMYVDNYYILNFNADSNFADLFKDTVDKYLKKIVVTKEDLERIKNVLIAGEIRIGDNLNSIMNDIQDEFVRYDKIILDHASIIKKMNLEEMNSVINDISFDNNTFVLTLPNGSR